MDHIPTLAVVGAGAMGGAIVRGLVGGGFDPGRISVSTRSAESAAQWREAGVRAISLEEHPEANSVVASSAGVVLLAVKPVMIRDTLAGIAPALDPVSIVVSVAAGVTCATMEAIVPNPVIRAMPNTPVVIRAGVTGLAAGPRAGEPHREIARRLFGALGAVVELPEERIDLLSAISGSGPATYAFLVERLTESAERLGFDPAEARLLAERTFIGTAALLEVSGDSPAELRRAVTSPKGSTARIIAELESADLAALFDRAHAAAIARTGELAEEG